MTLSKPLASDLLRKMCLTRAFEEQAERSYMEGKIHGTMHLSIGQEASGIGAVSVLRPTDYLLGHHRGHGLCIAKGADLNLMMAEFYGKEAGYCRGRGGSMHIADVAGGNLGANGVVGGGLPMAVGVGLGLKAQGEGRILACFFGDGAASAGAFHESLELAVLYQVPVVFVCENNQYAMSFPASTSLPSTHTPGMPYSSPNRARRSLVVNNTYRWRGHSKSDRNRYRTPAEIEQWQQLDPIRRFRCQVVELGLLSEAEVESIEQQARADIESARLFAEAAAEPALESIEEGVYAP